MRAAVYENYGGANVVHIQEMSKPVCRRDQLLVRVMASTVSSADRRLRSMELPRGFGVIGRLVFGVFRPRRGVLGSDFAGVVEEIGSDITEFAVGDAVFGMTGMSMGCHAEYIAVSARGAVAHKPENLSFVEAAALPFGATTCLHFFERFGGIRDGSKVLVVGASGAVGSAAVQLAKCSGAHVTGMCSTKSLEMVRSLGADEVLDYTIDELHGDTAIYDLIFDTSGTATRRDYQPMLARGGILILIAADLPDTLRALIRPVTGGRRLFAEPAVETRKQIEQIVNLSRTDGLKPVVGQVFPFEAIADAHRFGERTGKFGNALVSMLPAATDHEQSEP